MKYTIYETTCLINGKTYVGKHQTQNPDDDYVGSGKLLVAAVKKHGRENFVKRVLHVFETEAEMNAKEAELVTQEFCDRDDNYNLCAGGRGGFRYINSENLSLRNGFEKRRHIARVQGRHTGSKTIANQTGIHNPEWRQKHIQSLISNKRGIFSDSVLGHWKNRKHSEATIEKMKRVAKGRGAGETNSQYGTIWITNGVRCKKILASAIIPEGYQRGRRTTS